MTGQETMIDSKMLENSHARGIIDNSAPLAGGIADAPALTRRAATCAALPARRWSPPDNLRAAANMRRAQPEEQKK